MIKKWLLMGCVRADSMLLAAFAFLAGLWLFAPLSAVAGTNAVGFLPNGVMLGTWNTQAEFSNLKVVSGTNSLLEEAFDGVRPGRQLSGGDWQISGGVGRQSGAATPALLKETFADPGTPYVVSVRARKTGGSEGFLVGFEVRNAEDYYWLNLGGWDNTLYRLEKSVDGEREPIGPAVKGKIENDRWYEIRIAVEKGRIQCYLDGQQIFDVKDSGFEEAAEVAGSTGVSPFGQALIPDLVADPSIVDLDGTFYCYATTDGWGGGLASSGTPVVWQSKDFVNWSFEGSSFPSDFEAKYWAPSTLVKRNGRYYSFPTLDGQVTAVVADSPVGPFTAADGKHIAKGTQWSPFPIKQDSAIDAEVFVDDDGQAYMVWSRRRMARLKPDLLSVDGQMVTIETKRQGYSEGPFLFKRKGVYYYLYTLGGHEAYQYAYMMSRTSPMGPWEAPEKDIIATTDHTQKVFGPGHGCFFHPQDSAQWYFVYLEYGRGGTTRQIYADKMDFNADGTIQPVQLTKTGVGALRASSDMATNLAAGCRATASSTRRSYKVRPRADATLDRVETYLPANALDNCNGSRWLADKADTNAWWQVDLGKAREIRRTEAYFVKPTAGHAYKLEYSLDGREWKSYGGHAEVVRCSPHQDQCAVRAQYLKLSVLQGEPGLWEFRVY
jgi:hypothetical protein